MRSNILIMCAATLLAIAVLELFVRVYFGEYTLVPSNLLENYEYGYKNKEHIKVRYQSRNINYVVNTGKFGLRYTGRPPKFDLPKGGILMIGDSFTFGLGVDDDETFPAIVESLLEKKSKTSAIYNAGIPGYGTRDSYYWLQGFLRDIPVEKVMLFFYINDFSDNYRALTVKDGHLYLVSSHSMLDRFLFNLIKSSATLQYLRRLCFSDAVFRRVYSSMEGNGSGPGKKQGFVYDAILYLDKIKKLVEGLGKQFSLVLIPLREGRDETISVYYDEIKHWCKNRRVACGDPTNMFASNIDSDPYDRYTHHFSDFGHRLMGRYVVDMIASTPYGN